jgi:pimeloyl-CoA synthetase
VSPSYQFISQTELKLYRVGLPKKGETFFFFNINDWSIHDFCKQLGELVPLITTAIQVQHDQARIAKEQKRARLEGTSSQILDMTGVNISFSQKGLLQVSDTLI